MSKMALSCLASNHLGYSVPRKQKHNGSLPLSSPLFHAKISLFYLMSRCHPRKQGPGSLTRALDIKVADSPIVENGQFQGTVEIPVNCYQILGVPIGCSKDQVVKAAMQLRATEIDEGYSPSVLPSRQGLLIDIRDKLLFEPEFSGDVKEHVPPKSSLILPWQWLPAAMSLLQEVGEEKIVMDIGRAVRQQPNAKPYIHDILLSMALVECSIARRGFERGTVSGGFEALARAQLLLRSKRSLAKLTLLTEIEASLEELAPMCLLENLGKPRTPENAERREGALAALRELLRQGLEGEASCAVRDWSVFLSQAMKKLLAIEIVSLLPWDTIALIRKNNNSSEAQQQRFVIDCNCFYIALLAHIALGFSKKRPELIDKAKKITESLEKTEAVDLGFERIICKTLLGDGKLALTEDLQKLGLNGNSLNQQFRQDVSRQANKGNADFYSSLKTC